MEFEQAAHYYLARSGCYTCLAVNDIVNTGVQIEGEGILAICKSCAADIARTAGYDIFDRLDELNDYKEKLRLAEQRALTAESVVAGIAEDAVKIKANREQLAAAREYAREKKLADA